MNCCPGRVTPPDRHLQSVDREARRHVVVDRVANDPVGEHIFDRTQVELAFAGPVLGDVGQPQRLGSGRGEQPLHQIVMGRRVLYPILGSSLLRKREHPDSICTNKTSVNFPATAGAKFAQTVQYGSQKWASEYKHDRNTIEGLNGFAKDESKEGLGTPGKRRLRGIAAQFLLISFIAVAANLRKIQAFRDEQLSSDSEEERAEKRKQKLAIRHRRKHRNDRVAPWGDFRSSDPPPDPNVSEPA